MLCPQGLGNYYYLFSELQTTENNPIKCYKKTYVDPLKLSAQKEIEIGTTELYFS